MSEDLFSIDSCAEDESLRTDNQLHRSIESPSLSSLCMQREQVKSDLQLKT